MISVTIIGSGNVGCHLFKAFNKANEVNVNQWFSRDINSIIDFKNKTFITDDLSQLKDTDVYILAISDDAISEVSSALKIKDRLVVHTSGSVNIHDLDKKHERGVFYPLQTFSKKVEVDFSKIPICIEVLDKKNLSTLKLLAEALGSKHYKINTEQRQTLHLSAVFINNFVNQLYRVAHEISDAKSINFDILKPLILETANKVQEMSPYMAQTGPAMRNDKKTIKRHLKLIENNTHKEIYELLTQSIKDTHGIK